MTEWDKLTRIEQSLLLGFLPLLGATAHAGAAVIAILILLVATGLIRAAAGLLSDRLDASTRWAIYLVIGFGVSHSITAAALFLLPIPESLAPWLLTTGLTPLAFCGAANGMTPTTLRAHLGRVCAGILFFALIREPLGSGALFGRFLWADGHIPMGLLSGSVGAFILPATVAMLDALRVPRAPSTEAAS